MRILGVRVDNLEKKEILEKISYFLDGNNFRQIATINPEIILKAQKDEEFRNILNECELNIADGFGIKLAFLRHGKFLKHRITGIDLMWKLLKIANERKMKVFLAADSRGLSTWEETRDAIKKIYPDLEVAGANFNCHSELARLAEAPAKRVEESNKIDKLDPLTSLRYTQDDKYIVFANFGAPFQEKFLNSQKNGNIKIAVGVGGSFDYITGKVRRAPLWMQHIGLEWLFRFWQQPKRWKRIFNATIAFPIKIIFKIYG